MQTYRELLGGALTLPDASLMPFAIGVLLVALVGYGVLRWAMRVRVARAARVYCPVHHATARVRLRIDPDGTPTEVESCDLLTRRGFRACDAACLKTLVVEHAA